MAIKIQILSATVKDQKIAGAEVIAQKNGESSLKGTTAADGIGPVREALRRRR